MLSVSRDAHRKLLLRHPTHHPSNNLSRTLLLSSTAILMAGSLALFEPARAANECGPMTGGGGTVTCGDGIDDTGWATFTGGITYSPTADLTMVIQDGLALSTSTANGIFINSSNTAGFLLSIIDTDTSNDITTSGNSLNGIFVIDSDNVAIASFAEISTSGSYSRGTYLQNTSGDINIDTEGGITTSGSNAFGIHIGGHSSTSVDYIDVDVAASSSISTSGASAHGILLTNVTSGNVFIANSGGIWTTGSGAVGIIAATTTANVDVDNIGTIITGSGAAISISSTTGEVDITNSGSIVTSGNYSYGVWVANTAGDVGVTASGSIVTLGNYSYGMWVANTAGDVAVTASGSIVTTTMPAGCGNCATMPTAMAMAPAIPNRPPAPTLAVAPIHSPTAAL
jgi:hypothetical protein